MWLSSPPIPAILTVIIAYIFSPGGGDGISFGAWTLVITFFLVLTLLYVWFAAQGQKRRLAPIQFMAQGTLLTATSLSFGGAYISWVGILLLLIGFVLAIATALSGGGGEAIPRFEPESSPPAQDMFDNYPYPALAADLSGKIISISDGMIGLLGIDRAKALEQVIPKDLFSLREHKEPETSEAMPQAAAAGIIPLLDAETNTYSEAYARMRTADEISRMKRYKRWGIFLLIDFEFSYQGGASPMSADTKEKMFFRSYCAFLKSTLRTCDVACRAGPFAVFSFLPETVSGEPLAQVIGKVAAFEAALADLVKGIPGEISMRVGSVFFNASMQDANYDTLVSSLKENLVKQQHS